MTARDSLRLVDVAPDLERILLGAIDMPPRFAASEIRRDTVWVVMRDGVRLATDLYFPPAAKAPTVAVRTPYGRAQAKLIEPFTTFVRHGYIVVSQDCRGTGDSEPDHWDYYVYESEDSLDFVEWLNRQEWFDGFLSACGGSYLGATQWCMAMHPQMSAIAPEVCGLGIVARGARCHMLLNAYARSVGKGADKVAVHFEQLEQEILQETLQSGYFNEPLYAPFSSALLRAHPQLRTLAPAEARRWLWEYYSSLGSAQRVELIKQAVGEHDITVVDVENLPSVFGHSIPHDAHLLPSVRRADVLKSLKAPALVITGWYDWFVDDALGTWEMLVREVPLPVRSRSRLLITPSAHLVPGYHENDANHPELKRVYRTHNLVGLLLRWYATVREDRLDSWPAVIFYLMGANEWYTASAWPPPEAKTCAFYLGPEGSLAPQRLTQPPQSVDYTFDPYSPTPTVGGSIISAVYPPGSVDVGRIQERPDLVVFTSAALAEDLDVVGPLRVILYASSSAVDTDFSVRLSDVFPDGRAIQLQSGMVRARYRSLDGEPELLEPGRVYRFEINLWATANRFKTGHRLRIDISSADFPRFDRNTNRGGESSPPISAVQRIYFDSERPSHVLLPIIGSNPFAYHAPPR